MDLLPIFLDEMEKEAKVTAKFLKLFPFEKSDWQPHIKSMKMQSLAVHIAELPAWAELAFIADGLDFATFDYKPSLVHSTQELVDLHEISLGKARKVLIPENEKLINEIWTLRLGSQILSQETKAETVRHAWNQITHHRAQLGVYYRLLNIELPSTYGPSADNQF